MTRKPREQLFARWVHTYEGEEWCSPFLGKYCHTDATNEELPIRTWPTRKLARTALGTNCYREKAKVRKCLVIIREVLPPRPKKANTTSRQVAGCRGRGGSKHPRGFKRADGTKGTLNLSHLKGKGRIDEA